MAWIEDVCGGVLMVKQSKGKKLWTLPGGKGRGNESLLDTLRRELKEETGLDVAFTAPVDIYDRPERANLTVLYRVLIKKLCLRTKFNDEIEAVAFQRKLPRLCTPSLKYFWERANCSFEPLSLLEILNK